ncbi:pentatricopeptide repeat-containing protein 1, mitochondrial-like, partial [Argonauta hians]
HVSCDVICLFDLSCITMSKLLVRVAKAIQIQSAINNNICRNKIPSLTLLNRQLADTSISSGAKGYCTVTSSSSELFPIPENNENKKTGKSKYNRKRYKRILSPEEKKENKNWSKLRVSYADDSFGDIWKNSIKSDFKKSEKTSKKRQKERVGEKLKLVSDESYPSLKSEPKSSWSDNFGSLPDRIQQKETEFEKTKPVSYESYPSLKSQSNSTLSDNFGSLADSSDLKKWIRDESDDRSFIDDKRDENEGKTHIRLSPKGRLHEPHWYAGRIKQLGKEGKILEAIDMLEGTMLKKDRVLPNTYVFNQLLGILGKAGYTKKAFSLFNKMKKMSIQPDGHTYTCLFNCCSNSPWSSDGLQRTRKLHALITEKDIGLHPITYKAMIKSYSVCGDIQTAFQVADTFCEKYRPDTQLFSFLLMGCISEKEAGLRHAIQVWKQMTSLKIKPDLPLYNLLIRVIRDAGCGAEYGNVHNFPKYTPVTSQGDFNVTGKINEEYGIPNSNANESVQPISSLIENDPKYFNLSVIPKELDLAFPDSRLALIGGPFSILQDMKENSVKPNVLTFSQIVDCLPLNNKAEEEILDYMKTLEIKPDIDLYNMIIRRRNRSFRYKEAKNILFKIGEDNLHPNLRTFGCSAMGCTNLKEAKLLLHSIDEAGMEPNIEIFSLLLSKSYMDFKYKMELLGMMPKWDLKPNTKFLQHIENHISTARKKILQMEQKNEVNSYFQKDYFKKSFKAFMQFYSKWLQSVGFDKPEHPWSDFQHPKISDENTSE